MSFPSSPTNGATTTTNGINYSYSTSTNAWKRVASTITTIGTSTIAGTASSYQYTLGISNTLTLVPAATWASAVPITLADNSTITVDLSTGLNFTCTLTTAIGATRILGNPVNTKPGQTGFIQFTQSTGGSPGNAVTFGTNWHWAGGTTGTLTTATVGANDILFYSVLTTNYLLGSIVNKVI